MDLTDIGSDRGQIMLKSRGDDDGLGECLLQKGGDFPDRVVDANGFNKDVVFLREDEELLHQCRAPLCHLRNCLNAS